MDDGARIGTFFNSIFFPMEHHGLLWSQYVCNVRGTSVDCMCSFRLLTASYMNTTVGHLDRMYTPRSAQQTWWYHHTCTKCCARSWARTKSHGGCRCQLHFNCWWQPNIEQNSIGGLPVHCSQSATVMATDASDRAAAGVLL
jgi:hypothetical protein